MKFTRGNYYSQVDEFIKTNALVDLSSSGLIPLSDTGGGLLKSKKNLRKNNMPDSVSNQPNNFETLNDYAVSGTGTKYVPTRNDEYENEIDMGVGSVPRAKNLTGQKTPFVLDFSYTGTIDAMLLPKESGNHMTKFSNETNLPMGNIEAK